MCPDTHRRVALSRIFSSSFAARRSSLTVLVASVAWTRAAANACVGSPPGLMDSRAACAMMVRSTGDTIPMVGLPTVDAYRHAFWITAVGCLVAAVVPFAIHGTRSAATVPVAAPAAPAEAVPQQAPEGVEAGA